MPRKDPLVKHYEDLLSGKGRDTKSEKPRRSNPGAYSRGEGSHASASFASSQSFASSVSASQSHVSGMRSGESYSERTGRGPERDSRTEKPFHRGIPPHEPGYAAQLQSLNAKFNHGSNSSRFPLYAEQFFPGASGRPNGPAQFPGYASLPTGYASLPTGRASRGFWTAPNPYPSSHSSQVPYSVLSVAPIARASVTGHLIQPIRSGITPTPTSQLRQPSASVEPKPRIVERSGPLHESEQKQGVEEPVSHQEKPAEYLAIAAQTSQSGQTISITKAGGTSVPAQGDSAVQPPKLSGLGD